MPGVVELVDRAVALPPGPELSATLAELAWSEIPNARLVEVLQARSRQLAHEQARLLAGLAEIARAIPVADLPADDPHAVARAADDVDWASHEIAAGLTWTPNAADRELAFALVLVHGLPLVYAALEQGLIDRAKAKVFADHLDPARGELTPTQIRRLCERFVPRAPKLTTRQLSRQLLAAIQAIDPEYHRRRYRRGLRERGVVLHLDRDGTATLSGEGLPPDEAAAAAARLDRLAEAAKRAGHPGRLPQINADLYLGMLDGSFHGLTETQILDLLLAHTRPEDSDDDVLAPEHSRAPERPDSDAGFGDEVSPGGMKADVEPVGEDDKAPVGGAPDGKGSTSARPTGASSDGERPDRGMPAGTGESRWAGEQVGIREGIELRVGLATLLGCDERPGEIPGLGPVDAEIARIAVTRHIRGAEWQFALVDRDGYLLLAGPLRRRPRSTGPPGARPPGRVRGGVVELHLTLTELYQFAADPGLTGEWAGLVAEIADRWADRHRLWRQLAHRPRARFARGAVARHVQVRDRTCIGPGCDRSARRSDLDHTRDHSHGGDTVEDNLGPGCWRHHADKNRGWRLSQPQPGHFVWISPLGRTYRTRGAPIRPDLPDPDPPQPKTDTREDPGTDQGGRLDLRILWREVRDVALPPPPPQAPDDEVEPPF